MPNAVLRDPDLSIGAKLTFAALLSYAWEQGRCFPGQERLAHDLGVTPRTVINYLKELQSKGLVLAERRGGQRTNRYFVRELTDSHFASDVKKVTGHEVKNLHTKKTQREQDTDMGFDSKVRPNQIKDSSGFAKSVHGTWERDGKRGGTEAQRSAECEDGTRNVDAESEERDGVDAKLSIEATGGVAARDASNDRIASPVELDDYRRLNGIVMDVAAELNDEAIPTTSMARARNLHRRSGMSMHDFLEAIAVSRRVTRQHAGGIRKRHARKGDGRERPNCMPYFFAVLEDVMEREASGGSNLTEMRATAGPPLNISSEPEEADANRAPPLIVPDDDLWSQAQAELSSLGPIHREWLSNAHGYELDGRLVLETAGQEEALWIEARLRPAILQALELCGRGDVELEVRCRDPEP